LDLSAVQRVEIDGAEADDRAEDVGHQKELVEAVVIGGEHEHVSTSSGIGR
jgi:hypothetical protein